jgi:hypothetical protein
MSGESKQHPGRSAEFLSRLHDGELDPGERAHFESHRAHCAECRRAARDFEDALSLFRSARSRPPQADLAGRILRKIQTSSRPRAPFSLRFRADLGWAALLLTGIFAILLSVRRPEPPVFVTFPTPVPGDTAPAEPATPQSKVQERSEDPPVRRERRVLPAPANTELGAVAKDSARRDEPAAAAAPPLAAQSKETHTPAREADRDQSRPAMAAEVGRAAGRTEESTAAPTPASPLRLKVEAIDGYGSAPPLLAGSRVTMPASYRGHEFILHVDAQGKVSEVRPGPTRERKEETTRFGAPAPEALLELQFQPGNRPRRLLVRFE